ncbi:MAG: FAD-binding protein [Desulfobacterales bacterium]|nr:FAD-binding protein [Desulfobacterales bacterium]
MISVSIIEEIIKVVGEKWCLTDPADMATYAFDGFFKDYTPDAVVLPKKTAEVSDVLQIANREKINIVPRGAGTNLSGTSVARRGGMIMPLTRMDRIIEIDSVNRCAIVQPGVVNAELQKAVEPFDLMYGPDPSSWYVSTVGGNISLNAGGPRALKYGSARDHLIGLEVVRANGEIVKIGSKTSKNAAGLDLPHLFCGAEGTLGIITEATVRLIPLPEAKHTLQAVFGNLDDACEAVSEIVSSGIIPSAMDLLDQILINLIQGYGGVQFPDGASALLLIEIDGHPQAIEQESEKIKQICHNNHAIDIVLARTPEENEVVWRARRSIGGTFSKVCKTLINEDATVPVSSLPDIMKKVLALREKYKLNIGIMAHAGDGNLHPSIMTDAQNQDEMKRVDQFAEELYREALSLGGSLSGEHGIGLAKKSFMSMQFEETALKMMREIKRLLDPNNILNPGSYLDEER